VLVHLGRGRREREVSHQDLPNARKRLPRGIRVLNIVDPIGLEGDLPLRPPA
jgi:hypothetical protein